MAPSSVIAVLLLNDLSIVQVLRYVVYFSLVIVLPGTIVWDYVMGRVELVAGVGAGERTRLEDLVCGACVGYAIELPAYALSRWMDVPRMYAVVQAVIVVVWLFRRRPWTDRSRAARPGWGPLPSLGLGAVIGYSAAWLGARAFAAFPLDPAGRFPDADDPFQLSLVAELRHHFPAVYPYVAAERLDYQYFYHLHAAASTWITGLSPLQTFGRFDPVMFTVLSATGAACVARRLSRNPWAGVLAAGTLTVLGAFDVTGIFRGQANLEERFLSVLLVHGPTQAMAFALVTPLMVLCLVAIEHGRGLGRTGTVAFFALCVTTMGAKVTFVPMLLAGLLTTWLLSIVLGRPLLPALRLAMVSLLSIVTSVVLVYRGGSRGLSWDPLSVAELYGGHFPIDVDTTAGKAYAVASAFVVVSVPAAGVLGLLKRRARSDLRVWMLLFTGAAGYAACGVFGHPGHSQRFFLYSAVWFMSVASGWGVVVLFSGRSAATIRRYLAIAAVSGSALFAVRLVAERHAEVHVTSDGGFSVRPGIPGSLDLPIVAALMLLFVAVGFVRRPADNRLPVPIAMIAVLVGLGLARPLALVVGNVEPVKPPKQAVTSQSGVAATAWLRHNAPADDLVATNSHCRISREPAGRRRCDNRHFWMSAFTERRFLIEGWGYVEHLATDFYSPFGGDPHLLRDNDLVFTSPTSARLQRFMRQRNVRWLLVDRRLPNDWNALVALPETEPVFLSRDYAVIGLTWPE